MIKIAHRGNINGPKPELENTEQYLLSAIEAGFDVEADVWMMSGTFFLGHDSPLNETSLEFLKSINTKAWFHCKNLDALYAMRCQGFKNYFWHQNDDYSLTNHNFIWTFPGKSYGDNSIVVDLGEGSVHKYEEAYGVCGDYLE